MGLRRWVFHSLLDVGYRLTCHIDTRDFARIPAHGPGLLISNHTSNWEGPVYYLRLRDRAPIALAKAELWDFFLTRHLMNAWKAIPVRRGRLDRRALERAASALQRGQFLGVAPEGRRSPDGVLQKGQAGAAWFALDKEIPVYPMAQWGFRDVPQSLRRLHRARVVVKVGRPFVVRTPQGLEGHPDLNRAIDEMMGQIALLLPEELRGPYTTIMAPSYLHFL